MARKRARTPRKSKNFVLKLPKFVTLPQVHRLIERAQPILFARKPFVRFTVDARELAHISPVGLATLVSIVRHAMTNGHYVKGTYRHPEKRHVRTYLSRMNFGRLIGLQDVEHPRRSRSRGRFRELVEVGTAEDCSKVADQLRRVLTKQVALTDVVLNNVTYCVLELLENVIHHAQSSTNGVACAQAYPKSHAVELAIVDCGIGVRASLAKNPEHAPRARSDADAILLALQKGVTSTPERNTGEGLFFVAELMTEAGRMRVQSGEAMLAVSRRAGMVTKPAPAWPGTLVGLRFEPKRAVSISEIFGRFTRLDEESGLFLLSDDSG